MIYSTKLVFSLNAYNVSLQAHMEWLCEKIGARPTGSVKNKGVVDYVLGVFKNCGFQVCKQEFDCIGWVNSGATLLVDGQVVPVESAEYSLFCSVDAEFVCVDTVEALKKVELTGKILVIFGALCQEPLMPKNFKFYNPYEHKQIIALLEEKNPKAIITVSPHKQHIIQDGDFNIPCAVVCDDLLDIFLQSTNRKAKLTISAERVPVKAHNVIATYGTGRDRMCFCAHIDTKPATPGALDNASGVSVLLTLAEYIANIQCPFQIEFVLLNGEDYYSTPGEMAYMMKLTPDYLLAVNVDGVGLRDSDTSISFYECPQELETQIMKCVKKTAGIERIEPWHMGDHMLFVNRAIPVIALTSYNIFSILDTVIHTPADDMKNIDLHALDKIVHFLLNCLSAMNKPVM